VNPAAAASFAISAPASVTPGKPFSFVVTALEAFSNAATAYQGAVTFSLLLRVVMPRCGTLKP
jgi:hypothetical protein